jgi:hypothetical protein
MRELVQQTTSGSTELAASAEQMSKMSRGLLDSMDSFSVKQEPHFQHEERGRKTRAAAGGR